MKMKSDWTPGQPLPKNADKATGATIVTHLFFPISPRTLETWPLTVRRPNNANIYEVAELLAVAQAKLDAAPTFKQNA